MPINDLKKLHAEVKRLKRLAYRDELTGLFNRRGFKDEAYKFLHQIVKEKEGKRRKLIINSFGAILIDLDFFKKINDTFGHDAGDAALKHVSKIILERARDIDVVGRWGGEEIVIGLIGADERDAELVAETIRERVEASEVVWKRKKFKLTLSAGVARFDGKESVEGLIARADKALYKAKHTGRNRVVKFSDLK